MITLRENIARAKNLINSIESLSNPNLYVNLKSDYHNKRHLRKTVKNFKRLTVVIEKQLNEGYRNNFKESTGQIRSRQLNNILK